MSGIVLALGTPEIGQESTQVFFHLFGLAVTSQILTEWGLMLVVLLVVVLATRRLQLVPRGGQNALELGVEMIMDGILIPALGSKEKARRYFPFLASLFVFILASNYSELLPGANLVPGFKTPTSTLSVTAALAIIAFLTTHVSGFVAHGPGYLKHFVRPSFFMLPLNIVEELIRPLSLALRLFGNIFGEDSVLLVMLSFLPWIVPVPFMVLFTLFGLLQAFIFTMLTGVYIAGATEEAE
ncbi:MAG: F0F1 ATP synthase subunit A [Bacillota bacterium]|nr:F0F1 ATP synthase subunit A [Bacillota bacterium]